MIPRASILLLLAASAVAQPIPVDTLRAPAEADSITVFGWTVDADADRVLVGARVWPPPYTPPPEELRVSQADHHGTVFVYRRQADGSWAVEGRLKADYISNEDCFGWSMDLRGDLAVIGAECEYTTNPDGSFQIGATYIYRYDGGGWSREAKLSIVNAEDEQPTYRFGESVAVGNGFVVVGTGGAPNPSNPEGDSSSGAAHVFERVEDVWERTAILRNEDADEQINEYFGGTVEALSEAVLVGAALEDAPDAPNRGALYIFEREGEAWTQQVKLIAPESTSYFGSLLDANGGGAAVGFDKGLYAVDRSPSGWDVGERIFSHFTYGFFGIARHGDRIAAFDYGASEVREVVRFFMREGSDSEWEGVDLDLPLIEQHRDELVSLTGRHAFVGLPQASGGEVLVYDLSPATPNEPSSPESASFALTVAPNPVRRGGVVRFELSKSGDVRLTVYDVLGREVVRLAEGARAAGEQTVELDAGGLAPGVYVVRVQTEQYDAAQRFTVVR